MITRCCCISGSRLFCSRFNAVNSMRCRNYHVISNASFFNKYNLFDHRYEFRRNINHTPSILAAAAVMATESTTATLTTNSEPSFVELGLGGYTPVGILQNGLEFLHVSYDLPWFATIAISTVIIRILITPLAVLAQRNTAVMCNVLPQVNDIQSKMVRAGKAGNTLEFAQYNEELKNIMKDKRYNPIKNMLVPLAQAPIFISYYFGINAMVDAPVLSLQTGGIFWFTDLTVADPYYILPLISCGTIALTIYTGTDGARSSHPNKLINYVIKALPVIIFPFIMNFPAAIVIYWTTSNFWSLIQAPIFRIEKVRKFLKIPKINPVQPKKQEQSDIQNVKSFVQPKKVTKNIINYELLISRNIKNSKK
ncbi:mitochondrial inner membrane protein OXA1L-like isoform X2 [Contarinia nasturtii]|uniref:mitochondrial inner membrane protein OXA1L-like isoform X2 n=1 Tax=Contarinia nasturtii TaxID=265458 RepID=UPI0012D49FE7|nr:mitochondrial inner membrane protein OXA1L-like isoform X2 [Contarinia nasturtii]